MKKYTVILLLTAIALAPLFLLAAYNHPTDDDYCTYQSFHGQSAWDALDYGYHSFSGRFTYLLLFSQWDPLYHSDWLLATRLWPLLTLIAFLVTLRVLTYFLLGSTAPREQWIAWCVLTSTSLASWPSLASSFYWYTGATVYTIATLCAVISLVALFKSLQPGALLNRVALLVGSCILALIAVGSNEVLITFLLCFTILLLLWTKRDTSRFPLFVIVFFLVIAAGAYLALSAPGNFKRASDMLHRTADISYALQVGIKSVYLVTLKTGSWLSSVSLWLTGMLVAAVATPASFSWLAPRNRSQLAIMPVLLFMLMIAMVFLSCYAYNDVIPRIWNLVYFVFVFGFIYLLVFAVHFIPTIEPVTTFVRGQWSAIALVTVLVCLVSSSSNLSTAWTDLFFKAKEYDAAMLKRYETLQSARESGQQTVVVEPLFRNRYQYPRTLFLNDIGLDAGGFPNTCISYFFRVDSLKLSCCPQDSRHLE